MCKNNDRAALLSSNKISLLQFHFVICSVSISKYMIEKLGCEDHWYPKSLQQKSKVNEYLDWQQSNIMAWCSMVFLQDVSVNKKFAFISIFFLLFLLMSGTLIFHLPFLSLILHIWWHKPYPGPGVPSKNPPFYSIIYFIFRSCIWV